jgi:hypothetical protein
MRHGVRVKVGEEVEKEEEKEKRQACAEFSMPPDPAQAGTHYETSGQRYLGFSPPNYPLIVLPPKSQSRQTHEPGLRGGQDRLCRIEGSAIEREEQGTPVDSHNYKAGLAMSQRTVSAEKLQEIHDLAANWGKIVARRAFGEPGPGTDIDFQTMEQIAAAAARGLIEGTLTTLVEQQAQALPAEQPCPDCGHLCPVGYADRPLAVKDGQITLHEPVCHCPACRRDFFPPAAGAASGQPQLQPDRAADDR